MYRCCFYDLNVYIWCLKGGLKFDKACLNTLYNKVPSFFWFNPFLEARAEIKKLFRSFFGSNENKKICFWNLLTFRRFVRNTNKDKGTVVVSGHIIGSSRVYYRNNAAKLLMTSLYNFHIYFCDFMWYVIEVCKILENIKWNHGCLKIES